MGLARILLARCFRVSRVVFMVVWFIAGSGDPQLWPLSPLNQHELLVFAIRPQTAHWLFFMLIPGPGGDLLRGIIAGYCRHDWRAAQRRGNGVHSAAHYCKLVARAVLSPGGKETPQDSGKHTSNRSMTGAAYHQHGVCRHSLILQ
ncbi:hypothetical protein RRG08_048062 [Elysia crispata]|uniref:Uncharacterized protein n=1 Tax=Elysia crispata TaxID=231223 RepID=A0AAE1D9T9_9GAST|nr:hypothetical protein RRG08_048062 [Elysia crispata]